MDCEVKMMKTFSLLQLKLLHTLFFFFLLPFGLSSTILTCPIQFKFRSRGGGKGKSLGLLT